MNRQNSIHTLGYTIHNIELIIEYHLKPKACNKRLNTYANQQI